MSRRLTTILLSYISHPSATKLPNQNGTRSSFAASAATGSFVSQSGYVCCQRTPTRLAYSHFYFRSASSRRARNHLQGSYSFVSGVVLRAQHLRALPQIVAIWVPIMVCENFSTASVSAHQTLRSRQRPTADLRSMRIRPRYVRCSKLVHSATHSRAMTVVANMFSVPLGILFGADVSSPFFLRPRAEADRRMSISVDGSRIHPQVCRVPTFFTSTATASTADLTNLPPNKN